MAIAPSSRGKRFEEGIPLKAFPTASKNYLFLEDAAGGRGEGDPTPSDPGDKNSPSRKAGGCGGRVRGRSLADAGGGSPGLQRSEDRGNPQWRA